MTTNFSLAQDLRRSLLQVVSQDEIKALQSKSTWRSISWLLTVWLGVGVAWAVSYLTFTASPWLCLLVVPVAMAYVATRIHAFSVQIHEGSHYLLAPSRQVSDRITNFGAGYWVLNSVQEYRTVHNLHHKHLHEDKDPDGALYLGDMSAARLRKDLLADLTGLTALQRGRTYMDSGEEAPGLTAWIPKIAANLVLWVGWMLQAGFWVGSFAYGLLWAIPLLSLFPALTRLRVLGEHHSPSRQPGQARFVARTTECNFVTRHLIGGRMEYHFEHHLLPGIPYRNLPAVHRQLLASGFFEETEGQNCEITSPSYITFWRTRLVERASKGPGNPLPHPAPKVPSAS